MTLTTDWETKSNEPIHNTENMIVLSDCECLSDGVLEEPDQLLKFHDPEAARQFIFGLEGTYGIRDPEEPARPIVKVHADNLEWPKKIALQVVSPDNQDVGKDEKNRILELANGLIRFPEDVRFGDVKMDASIDSDFPYCEI